jgi:hypothetical protein
VHKLLVSVSLVFAGITLAACSPTSVSTSSNDSQAALSIAHCAPGLDIPDSSSEVKCSVAADACATPAELCRLASGTTADDGTNVGGKCVCDPRRVNDPPPGKQDCLSIGDSCVSASACATGAGTVDSNATCSNSGTVCCANLITSPNDPGCAGANLLNGDCVDADANALPSVCCAGLSGQEGAECGGNLAPAVTCASGLTCVVPVTGVAGQIGTCQPATSSGQQGAECGGNLAPAVTCASGLTCVVPVTGVAGQIGTCQPATSSGCATTSQITNGGACVDANGNPQDQTCCGGGSDCEVEDGAACVASKKACESLGGTADGNDCNGSTSGHSYCCAFN